MNIAIIPGTFFPDPGGAQVQAHNLANQLKNEKINVDIYLFKKTNIKKKKYKIFIFNKIIINFVFFLNYYLNIHLDLLLDFYIKKIIKLKNYQVWHFIFLNYKSLLIINSLKRLNQKIIVTFQGADVQIKREIFYGNRLDKKYDKLLKFSLRKIDYFTAISRNIFKDLINLGVCSKKIFKIPNGIPLNKFQKQKKKQNLENTLKIITVARYSPKKKGYDLVHKITKKLIEKKVKFLWIIVGKNTLLLKKYSIIKENLKYFKIIDNLNCNNEMYLPDTKLIKLYKSSDLYANLSRIESFGITFIEAFASGLPILTFNSKGANELVKNNYNGIILKKNNLDNFIKKLMLINKKKLLLNKNAFKSSKKFDLNLLVHKYIKIYKKILHI